MFEHSSQKLVIVVSRSFGTLQTLKTLSTEIQTFLGVNFLVFVFTYKYQYLFIFVCCAASLSSEKICWLVIEFQFYLNILSGNTDAVFFVGVASKGRWILYFKRAERTHLDMNCVKTQPRPLAVRLTVNPLFGLGTNSRGCTRNWLSSLT